MIKFFRKIRQNLLSEGKTGKYLKYAIGEIILVMVGILLALQVNNWNENKILVKKEITILKEIKKNLESDLENQIIPGARHYQRALDSYDILQSNFYNSPQSMPEDSIRPLYFKLIIPYKLAFNTVAFDNLRSIGVDLISNDSIRENISLLYGYDYKIITNYYNLTQTTTREDFMPLLADNVNMFKPLSESDLDYLKNDLGLNSRLRGLVSRRNVLRKYFINVKFYVDKLIVDIETEIERLDN